MRPFLIAAMLAFSTATFAADPAIHPGDMLRDANSIRLGSVEDITPDGTVDLIVDGQYVQVPMSTIKIVDGKAVTSMTKKEIMPPQ